MIINMFCTYISVTVYICVSALQVFALSVPFERTTAILCVLVNLYRILKASQATQPELYPYNNATL